jgi:hypothetical protein
MENGFSIWQISDNPKIINYLSLPSPTSKTSGCEKKPSDHLQITHTLNGNYSRSQAVF